jgi:hypothetical protein
MQDGGAPRHAEDAVPPARAECVSYINAHSPAHAAAPEAEEGGSGLISFGNFVFWDYGAILELVR